MLVQSENLSLIEAEAFPDGVAALDGGIERADSSLVAVQEFPIDVDKYIAVARVVGLQHKLCRQSMIIKFAIVTIAFCEQFMEARWDLAWFRFVSSEGDAGFDFLI